MQQQEEEGYRRRLKVLSVITFDDDNNVPNWHALIFRLKLKRLYGRRLNSSNNVLSNNDNDDDKDVLMYIDESEEDYFNDGLNLIPIQMTFLFT